MISLDEFVRDVRKLLGWLKGRKGKGKSHPKVSKVGKWFKKELFK